MSKTFLVKYLDFQRPILVQSDESVKEVIGRTFEVENVASLRMQIFDKEWEDWIDISDENTNSLENRSKLKCFIFNLPKPTADLSVHNTTLSSCSNPRPIESPSTWESQIQKDLDQLSSPFQKKLFRNPSKLYLKKKIQCFHGH